MHGRRPSGRGSQLQTDNACENERETQEPARGRWFAQQNDPKSKLTVIQAAALVEDWQALFPVVAATPGSLRLAMRAVEQHNLSFWDAMQWAVAKQAGATLLLSEDLQHDRELEGVRFRNPFVAEDPFGDPTGDR